MHGNVLPALFLSLMALIELPAKNRLAARKIKGPRRGRRPPDHGMLDIKGALGVAALIIGAVVAVQILAALVPTWFTAIGNITTSFNDASTGDATADALLPIFRLLIALAGVFAIVGAALLAVSLRNR